MKTKIDNSKYIFAVIFLTTIFIFKNAQCQTRSFEEGVIFLSEYIASEEFKNKTDEDVNLVDTLYLKALNFYDGNISEALLALTFSTLPFNRMPVTIPLVKLKLNLRLPSVDEKLFQQKNKNLPGLVYFDSNESGNQDKDKVAHFFGNAFLSYNVTFLNLSKFLGIFVEMFEETFKVSGKIDFRDLQTNYCGEFFGKSLRNQKDLYPSDFFKLYSLFYFSYN